MARKPVVKGKAPVAPEKPIEPKLSRAERSALRKAEHAKLTAEREAARKSASEPSIEALVEPEPEDMPRAAPDPHASAGAHAGAHAHAREGEVLSDDEFAGLVDEPVPMETPATARHIGKDHTPTDKTNAEVMAMRYAGQNDEEIALYLKVSMATLYRDYRDALADAHATFSGKLAVRMATFGLNGDFKAARFLAEKRLRGFGRQDQAFVPVRDNVGFIDPSLRAINGQDSPAVLAMRGRKKLVPDENGEIHLTMALGVAERPLKLDANGNVVEDEVDDVEGVVKRLAGLE